MLSGEVGKILLCINLNLVGLGFDGEQEFRDLVAAWLVLKQVSSSVGYCTSLIYRGAKRPILVFTRDSPFPYYY